MKPKDIVKADIEFGKPPELPILWWIDGLRLEMRSRAHRQQVWDIVKNRYNQHIVQMCPDIEELQCCTLDWPKNDQEWRNQMIGWEFGGVWPVGGFTLRKFKPVYGPLEHDLDADLIDFPKPEDPLYLSKAEKQVKEHADKYLVGYVWFTVFEKMHLMAGLKNILLAPKKQKDRFLRLRDKIMDFNRRAVKRWLDLGVDAIFISDDWGTQDQLLIPLEQWREFYKPCYKEIIDQSHAGGAHVWLHSCGHVIPIVEDLIEIGLDVLHPIQAHANDPKELADKFGGRICFCGGIDAQDTLINKGPVEVEKEVIFLFDTLCKPFQGGYIPGPMTTIIEDVPVENVRAIYTALDKVNAQLPWKQ
jgi:uroporphyrinogen-III decarboxylase